jgi:hypothetical protein
VTWPDAVFLSFLAFCVFLMIRALTRMDKK